MPATMTTVSQLLKNYYIGPLRTAVNNESMITQLCTKDSESVSGTTAIIAIHYARNSAVAFGTESGTVPSSGSQRYIQVATPTKKVWGTWTTTAEIEAASRDIKGAFANVMKREMLGLKDDITNLLNKHFVGDGTGILGTCDLQGPSADVVLNAASIARGDIIFFEEGMIVDIWGAAAIDVANAEIASVNIATSTITFTAPVTVAANASRIVLNDSWTAADTYIGIQGLGSCISTATLFGVTTPKYRSIDMSAVTGISGNRFNEYRMESVLDTIKTQGNGEVPDFWLTSYKQLRYYKEDIKARERRQVDTIKFKSGRSALAYDYEGKQIAIMADRYMRPNYAYTWKQDHLVQYVARELDWHAPNGGVLLQVPNTTQQQGILFTLIELAPRIRNASAFAAGTWGDNV